MAIVKHIKSRNANYSAAINYLLFEHDEKTGKKIVDESGRSILRKEFYMDGLNCDPMSFDKECELTNAHFHKNKKREDIKSHHYIISYDLFPGFFIMFKQKVQKENAELKKQNEQLKKYAPKPER